MAQRRRRKLTAGQGQQPAPSLWCCWVLPPFPSGWTQSPALPWRLPHAEGSPPTTPISPGFAEGFADMPVWTDAWRPAALGEPTFLSSEQTRDHSRVLPREASRSSGLSAGARRPGTANCPLSAPWGGGGVREGWGPTPHRGAAVEAGRCARPPRCCREL